MILGLKSSCPRIAEKAKKKTKILGKSDLFESGRALAEQGGGPGGLHVAQEGALARRRRRRRRRDAVGDEASTASTASAATASAASASTAAATSTGAGAAASAADAAAAGADQVVAPAAGRQDGRRQRRAGGVAAALQLQQPELAVLLQRLEPLVEHLARLHLQRQRHR